MRNAFVLSLALGVPISVLAFPHPAQAGPIMISSQDRQIISEAIASASGSTFVMSDRDVLGDPTRATDPGTGESTTVLRFWVQRASIMVTKIE